MNDLITLDQLDAMSDEEFCGLFAGGAALASLIVTLGMAAVPAESEAAS
jgi:hypothetical protein